MNGDSPSRHRDRRLLAAILVIAAAVRFWGIWFGLPLTQARPDESVVNGIAIGFLSGDLHPHFFDYPTLFLYLLAALDLAYYIVGRAAGWFFSVPHFMAQWDQAWSGFYLIGRCFAAALGTATVLLVYRLAARLFGSRCALVASLFLALSFLHVRDSHFGVTDVPVTLLVCGSMLAIVDGHRGRDSRQFFIAGVLAGLAASIKYNAVLLVVPMAFSQVIAAIEGWREKRSWWRDSRLLVFGGAFAAAFLLGTPYALLDPKHLVEGFRRVSTHLELGHGIDLGPGWIYHFTVSLRYGLGWPVLAAAVCGMAVIARRDFRTALLFLSFPIASYLTAGSGRTVFIRYIIPILPFLCIAAAVAIDAAVNLVSDLVRVPLRLRPALIAGLALVAIVPSAVNLVQADMLLARTDNRLLVTAWLRERAPSGASIYQSDTGYGRLELEDAGHRPWYQAWAFDGVRGAFVRGETPQTRGPDWIVIQRSPLMLYSRVPEPVEALVASGDYVRVRSFIAIDVNARGNVFDQQDAFFLPIAGFRAIRRPGPNFDVYQRRSKRPAVP